MIPGWVVAVMVAGAPADVGSVGGPLSLLELDASIDSSQVTATSAALWPSLRSQPTGLAKGRLSVGAAAPLGEHRLIGGLTWRPHAILEPGFGEEPLAAAFTAGQVEPALAAVFVTKPLTLRPRVTLPVIFDTPVHVAIRPSLQLRAQPLPTLRLGLDLELSVLLASQPDVIATHQQLVRRCADTHCLFFAFEPWTSQVAFTGQWLFDERWSVAARAVVRHGTQTLPVMLPAGASADGRPFVASWSETEERVEVLGTWSAAEVGLTLNLGGGLRQSERYFGHSFWAGLAFWVRSDRLVDRLWFDL